MSLHFFHLEVRIPRVLRGFVSVPLWLELVFGSPLRTYEPTLLMSLREKGSFFFPLLIFSHLDDAITCATTLFLKYNFPSLDVAWIFFYCVPLYK